MTILSTQSRPLVPRAKNFPAAGSDVSRTGRAVPIGNSATGSGAGALGRLILTASAGGVLRMFRADAAGAWTLYDLAEGTYWVYAMGGVADAYDMRQWKIVVSSLGVATTTAYIPTESTPTEAATNVISVSDDASQPFIMVPLVSSSGGVADAGKGVVLGSTGKLADSFYTFSNDEGGYEFALAATFTQQVTFGAAVEFLDLVNGESFIFTGDGNVAGAFECGELVMTGPVELDLSVTTGNLRSGTYTPTITNGTNVAASTASVSMYTRIGNIVSVWFTVSIDPTATGGTTFIVSLPIATDITTTDQAAGTLAGYVGGLGFTEGCAIVGATGLDAVECTFVAATAANHVLTGSFSYRIA